jgi:hypothetical protein
MVCTRNYIIHTDNVTLFCQYQGRTIENPNETHAIKWLNLLLKIVNKMNTNKTIKSKEEKEIDSIMGLEQFKN